MKKQVPTTTSMIVAVVLITGLAVIVSWAFVGGNPHPAKAGAGAIAAALVVMAVLAAGLIGVPMRTRNRVHRAAYIYIALCLIFTLTALMSSLAYALSYNSPKGCVTTPHAANACAFNQRLTRVDAVYFTLATITTTGYGDITPVSEDARTLVAAEMGITILVFVVALGRFITNVSEKRVREV